MATASVHVHEGRMLRNDDLESDTEGQEPLAYEDLGDVIEEEAAQHRLALALDETLALKSQLEERLYKVTVREAEVQRREVEFEAAIETAGVSVGGHLQQVQERIEAIEQDVKRKTDRLRAQSEAEKSSLLRQKNREIDALNKELSRAKDKANEQARDEKRAREIYMQMRQNHMNLQDEIAQLRRAKEELTSKVRALRHLNSSQSRRLESLTREISQQSTTTAPTAEKEEQAAPKCGSSCSSKAAVIALGKSFSAMCAWMNDIQMELEAVIGPQEMQEEMHGHQKHAAQVLPGVVELLRLSAKVPELDCQMPLQFTISSLLLLEGRAGDSEKDNVRSRLLPATSRRLADLLHTQILNNDVYQISDTTLHSTGEAERNVVLTSVAILITSSVVEQQIFALKNLVQYLDNPELKQMFVALRGHQIVIEMIHTKQHKQVLPHACEVLLLLTPNGPWLKSLVSAVASEIFFSSIKDIINDMSFDTKRVKERLCVLLQKMSVQVECRPYFINLGLKLCLENFLRSLTPDLTGEDFLTMNIRSTLRHLEEKDAEVEMIEDEFFDPINSTSEFLLATID